MKSQAERLLRAMGLYHRFKASPLQRLYWRACCRELFDNDIREMALYCALLRGFRRGDLIFDVGANKGVKTSTFLRLGARVVAFEPDGTNQQILRETFHRGRLRPEPVTVVPLALAATSCRSTMWIDVPGSAKNTLSRKWVETLRHDATRFGDTLGFAQQVVVETTTLDDMIAVYGRPFFIKIDVEGLEVEVLRGLHCPVPFLSFEVNLPEFAAEGAECVERLVRLSPQGRFNVVADYQRGLSFDRWLPGPEFQPALESCTEPSIEVFWQSEPTP